MDLGSPRQQSAIVEPLLSHAADEISERRKRNSLCGLCVLPPELIFNILLCVQDISEPATLGYSYLRYWPSLKWLGATHICHHWRSVALSFPLLWSRVALRSKDVCTAFLSRSTGALLDVGIWSEDLLGMVLDQLSRIRSLSIVASCGSYHPTSGERWVDLEASNLTFLSVYDVLGTNSHLIKLLFRSHMPQLQSLNMGNMDWKWTFSTLPSTLTSLSLFTDEDAMPFHLADMIEGLNTLGRLSLLENLDINYYASHFVDPDELGEALFTGSTISTAHSVALPKLRSFKCSGLVLTCLNVFNRLSIPPECKVQLHMDVTDSIWPRIGPALNFVNRDIFGLGTRTLRFRNSSYDMILKIWKTARPIPEEADIVVNFVQEDTVTDWPAFVTYFAENLHLSSVRTLELVSPPGTNLRDLQRILSRTPDIDRLHVHFPTLRSLLSILQMPVEDGMDADTLSTEPFLPHLRELELSYVSFSLSTRIPDGQSDACFLDWLRKRRERGVGIAILDLKDCLDLTSEEVEAMRAEVTEVRWDGISRPSDGPVSRGFLR